MNAKDIVACLERLRNDNPEQIIIVETPEGTVKLKIKDAFVYEGMRGEIVIDSE